jgi:hypothetical protein
MMDGAPVGCASQAKSLDWEELTLRFIGLDRPVPRIDGHTSYSVRYHAPGKHNFPPRFWHVRDGRIIAINEQKPQEGFPTFDRWAGTRTQPA